MIKVYVAENCRPCKMTKKKLSEKGLSYEEIPLTAELRNSFKEQGFVSAPIVVTDSETWAGFKREKIAELAS